MELMTYGIGGGPRVTTNQEIVQPQRFTLRVENDEDKRFVFLQVVNTMYRKSLIGVNSVTVSFRLDSSLRSRLAKEASTRRLSLNAYVQETLQKSIDWDALKRPFEDVAVSKEMLEALLLQIGDADLAAIARSAFVPRLKDLATLIHGKADFDGLLQVLELTAKYQYSFPVTYLVRKEVDGHHIFLRHGISKKWSVYLGEGCLAYLEAIHIRGSYEAMEKSLNLTISGKRPQRK